MVNHQRVTADYLGLPWQGDVVTSRRNTAGGGRPNETVENFAWEAWEAHIVLRLYESVRSQKIVDADSVVPFMSTFDQGGRFSRSVLLGGTGDLFGRSRTHASLVAYHRAKRREQED